MPTLDFKQISDKLSDEFSGNTRKIVFWYDDDAEFVRDVDALEIVGAKLHKLTESNQFYTKHLIEREDTESSYLIYAPFPKPNVRENSLEDTLLYSRRFFADRASLLIVDLRFDEKHKPVIQKHIKFFEEKNRTQRFYDFELENPDKETIEIALMSALCKTRTSSFEEVLRVVLTEGGFEDNKYLAEFDKYELQEVFWRICKETLGYEESPPSLLRLVSTLIATYTSRQYRGDMPQSWKNLVSYKAGNIIAFLDGLMNSIVYRPQYDELAEGIASSLNAKDVFSSAAPETIIDCDAVAVFDDFIIKWIVDRLQNEDIGATCAGLRIPAVCEHRAKMHYGELFATQYNMLTAAYEIISKSEYSCPQQFDEILKKYLTEDYQTDSHYRRFNLCYSRLNDVETYEQLRILVENIYTNVYLGKLLPAWNGAVDVKTSMQQDTSQLKFFEKKVKSSSDKTAVIISDALRYEVGCELFEKLNADANCKVNLKHLISVLPAYTQLGMAALLPHESLEIKPDGTVLVDSLPSDGNDKREIILQKTLPESRCVRADELPPKRDELREIFTGKDTVYIYHDRIDKRGSSSEDEVFAACSDAVDEIFAIIKRLSGSANVYNFIVTADHGFLYKRDKFTESERINLDGFRGAYTNRRFIIDDNPVNTDGVASAKISDIIGGDDNRYVSWPIGAYVFKTSGGLRYVHGGASPQEMVLPFITVKTEKGHVDTYPAKIALVTIVQKITNLIAQLEFIQKEPVSDTVKPVEYKLYFVSEDNERISNEHIYKADKKDTDPNKRMFRLRFNFKDKRYDNSKKYWLIAADSTNDIELFRHQVIMDIAFADGFGFDV